MDHVVIKHDLPSRRDMWLSLEMRAFLSSWQIMVQRVCGRSQQWLLPEFAHLARRGLNDWQERRLGDLVRRLVCQGCRQKPSSVVIEHPPSNQREELV